MRSESDVYYRVVIFSLSEATCTHYQFSREIMNMRLYDYY